LFSENQFCSLYVWDLIRLTRWVFWYEFFYQTFFILSIDFLPIFETQFCPTRFAIKFLFITVRAERKVRLCVILFYFFSRRILICLAWNLSLFVWNSSRFLCKILGKNYFGRIFHKFCANQGYHLPKLMKFCPTFCNFILGLYCVEKVHTSAFICCLHPSKEARPYRNHKKKIWEEKPGRFVFEEPVFLSLGLGLTTPHSLGILVWNFYHTFVIVSIEFWLRFEPQIRPTTFAISFLFITVRAKRKVCLCVKLFKFFPRLILIRFAWNLSRFFPKFSRDS